MEVRNFVRKPRNWIITTIVVCCILGLLFTIFHSSSKALPQYSEMPTKTTAPELRPIDYQYETYSSGIIPMTMLIPSEWNYVLKNGIDTFVNNVDAATIEINITEYKPFSNKIDETYCINYVASQNGSIGSFASIDTSSFTVSYEIGGLDFFEYCTWDLNNQLDIMITIPADRYDYYLDTIQYLMDSVQWQKSNPIPSDYYVFYNEYGAFQFGVPLDWVSRIENGLFTAMNIDETAGFTVSVAESDLDLSTITQLDYVNTYGQKSNYVLSTFSNTGTVITTESSYTDGGMQYYAIHHLISSNGFLYEFMFLSQPEVYDAEAARYAQAISLFALF